MCCRVWAVSQPNLVTFQLPYRTRDAGVIRQVAYFGLKWFLCLQIDTSSWKLTECLPQLWCPLHLYIYNSTHSIYTLDTNHFSSSVFLCKTYLKRWQCLWNNLSLWTLKCIFVTRIENQWWNSVLIFHKCTYWAHFPYLTLLDTHCALIFLIVWIFANF